MEWIASSKQGWSLERTPWPEGEPISPELDAQGYKDRLIRGMQWRIAHYKRVVRSNGAVNQPIWIQDWSTRKPPTKMYLRRCCLQDPDAERKNIDGLIETYYQEFSQIEALYQYHTQIGEQMRALVNFCKGTGKSSSTIESIVGIEVPTI
jgi:hypothetical protein